MMNAKMTRNVVVACLALFVGFSGVALAQGAGGGPGGGGRPGRGNWNPEEMRARMEQMMRDQLGASEEEWQVLGPLVNSVNESRRGMMGGMGRRMMGNRRGPQAGPEGQPPQAGPEGQPPQGAPEGQPPRGMGPGGDQNPEADALAAALDDPNTPAADIQAKLEAYRKAQVVKEAALKEAREKLRAAVTARQEARLVLMGILD